MTAARRALVTGAGGRLGAAMARSLGARGFDVAVHYAGSENGAEAVASDIRDMGRTAALVQADLLDDAAVAGLVGRASEVLGGPLTCLVNNASIFEQDGIEDASAGLLGAAYGIEPEGAHVPDPSLCGAGP